MGSGARLRSANQAFGLSRAGAFLLSAEPGEPVLPQCICPVQIEVTSLIGPTDGNVPASDGNCTCSTFPVVFDDRGNETRALIAGQNGLGWEDPPHPAFRVTGRTSGAVITVPEHCATQVCPGDADVPTYWSGYCVNLGATGADYVVVRSGLFAREGELPVVSQLLFAYYPVLGPGSPFIDGETADMEIVYTQSTLPDPGPYSIVSVQPDPNFRPDVMIFELDRSPRWTTQSVVEIAGTGSAYDGVWEARPLNIPQDIGPNNLSVSVPNYGTLGPGGTLTRNFSQAWECWHNCATPPGPAPEVPGGSTPQVLTVGEFNFAYGYEAGAFGGLAPTAWDGQTIEKLASLAFQDVTELRTVGNAPLYGTSSVLLSVEGIYGTFSMTPVIAGQGTYRVTSSGLKDYLQANVGNDLIIGISQGA